MTPQELKNSILWNAIQGKVTIQDPSECVSDLFGNTRITAVAEEDTYFDIPDNWRWVRIGEVFDLVNGKAFKPTDWSESGIPIVRIQNLNDSNAPYNYYSGETEEKYILHGGELLFSWSGTPGTSFGAFIWNGGHAVLNQHIFIVYPKINLDYEYAKYALNGELRIFIAKAHGGAGLKHIMRKEFDSCFLPIPPLAEQKRIVAKIEELLPLIDRYEKAWTRLEDFNKRFPGDMQKSILQMAIQGKLVEQRPEEGTGEELYQQIQKEKQALIKAGKTKKEKPLPEIAEDELPFDIPETWKWVRIGDAFITSSGTTPLSSNTAYYLNGEINWVRTTDLNNGILRSCEVKITKKAVNECKLDFIPRSSVCIAMYGGAGTIGKNALIEFDTTINQSVCAIHPNNYCNMKYLLFYMQFLRPRWMEYASGTRKDPNINKVVIKKAVFPLPPLAEQKRIVARLEELLPLCEKLK